MSIKLKIDFIYLAPALLCAGACLSGFIPSIFCLDGQIFAVVSLAVFGVSLLLHIYILCRWQHYSDSSPFAYAIVQPCLHMVLLVIALAVGSTSLCAAGSKSTRPFEDKNYLINSPPLVKKTVD